MNTIGSRHSLILQPNLFSIKSINRLLVVLLFKRLAHNNHIIRAEDSELAGFDQRDGSLHQHSAGGSSTLGGNSYALQTANHTIK
jgi:hypothetical protein